MESSEGFWQKVKNFNFDIYNIKHLLVFFATVFIFTLFLSYGILAIFDKKPDAPKIADLYTETLTPPEESEDVYSILLLGRGGVGHPGGTLADTNILVRVDTANKKVAIISIPRDLWVKIPTDFDNETPHKFNEAYSIALSTGYPNKRPKYKGFDGAGALSMVAAETVTGIKPDYHAAVDFSSFTKIIDLLGGIDVESKVAWSDSFYPVKGKENETCGKTNEEIASAHANFSGFQLEKQFECRYETIEFNKGTNSLDGKTALKYVRSRHSGNYGGDFARSEKQFAVLKAAKNKLISKEAYKNRGKIIDNLFSMVKTNLTLSGVKELIALFSNSDNYEIVDIYLTEDNVLRESKNSQGQFILLPKAGVHNWSGVQGFIGSKLQ